GADRDLHSELDERAGQRARRLRLILDGRLLGLDLGDRLADSDLVAGRYQPGLKGSFGGASQHFRHPDDGSHYFPPHPSRTRSRPAMTSSVRAIAARSSTFEMLGLASPPVTRSIGWSRWSKNRRWISSASQPPYEVPRAPCSTISTLLVLRMLSPMVSQSMDARSSQRRSTTSASMPDCSAASTQCCTIDR